MALFNSGTLSSGLAVKVAFGNITQSQTFIGGLILANNLGIIFQSLATLFGLPTFNAYIWTAGNKPRPLSGQFYPKVTIYPQEITNIFQISTPSPTPSPTPTPSPVPVGASWIITYPAWFQSANNYRVLIKQKVTDTIWQTIATLPVTCYSPQPALLDVSQTILQAGGAGTYCFILDISGYLTNMTITNQIPTNAATVGYDYPDGVSNGGRQVLIITNFSATVNITIVYGGIGGE